MNQTQGKTEVGQLREKMYFFRENLPELNTIADKLEAVLVELVGAAPEPGECTATVTGSTDSVIENLEDIHKQYASATLRLSRAMERLKQAV